MSVRNSRSTSGRRPQFFGGGANAFSRYENGKTKPPLALVKLLMVLDRPAYFLQRMKTKWGSCNHKAGHIRSNTELVKKPKDLLEYVIVHEMVHLIEPTHNDRFHHTPGALSHLA